MGEIKQNLNLPTSKKIEDSTDQPALKKSNNIDSEEEAFFNQLSDQILTGTFKDIFNTKRDLKDSKKQ